jgi:hypothetical protein
MYDESAALERMLPVGAPALNRDEAVELLEEFKAALLELRRLRAVVGGG